MSKERELLKRWLIDFGKIHPSVELMKETQNLLAKPEQESVYQKLSRIEDGIEVEILPSELWQDGYESGKRTKFYRLPPTREPLSDEVVKKFADAEYMVCNNAFTMGVRWAEQHHGITGVINE